MTATTAISTNAIDAYGWRHIALCASARSEEAARASDYRRANREGDTAALLYHSFYVNR
jgi:hypothetical protein